MKKKLIYIIFCFSCAHAIGLDGIDIPFNTVNLSLSSSGIGSNSNIFLNPASMKDNNDSSIGFSSNRWIQGLNGNSFYYTENGFLLSFFTIGTNDIEIRDAVASDEPIDLVSSNLLDLRLSKSLKLKNDFHIGVSTDMIYSQIFTDKLFDITFSFGLQKDISDTFKAGLLIENFGSGSDDISTSHGIGASYLLLRTNTEIIADLKYSDHYNGGVHLGIIQSINKIALSGGVSNYSNKRTTLSSGIEINVSKRINFTYSMLFITGSGLGSAHYFGLNFIL